MSFQPVPEQLSEGADEISSGKPFRVSEPKTRKDQLWTVERRTAETTRREPWMTLNTSTPIRSGMR